MRTRVVFSIGVVLILLMAIVGIFATNIDTSYEAYGLDELSVEQKNEVVYCGRSYITEEGVFRDINETETYDNALFSSLSFSIDGQEIVVDNEDVRVTNYEQMLIPGEYLCQFDVNVEGSIKTATARIRISKAELRIITLINGHSEYTVNEGEQYATSIEYDGFIGEDAPYILTTPPIIQSEPKMPTTGTMIVADLATSDRYEIIYVGAKIVINSNPDSVRTYKNGEEDVLILRGSFSPYYELIYSDLGLNVSDPKYAMIDSKVDKFFSGNRVFEEYEKANAYVINMYLDGQIVELNEPTNVRIKVPKKLLGKEKYRIIHFSSDGAYEFLDATETGDGYVSFTTSDLGEFLLLTPIEGFSRVMFIAACVIGVGLVVLIVLLVAIFRRKY